jgi:hypothetical protein
MRTVLVGTDFPDRCRDLGVPVNVVGDWANHGSSADHGAVVFHWTASSAHESPSSCANYCAFGKGYPLYNVLMDRTGVAWLLARERSESSGDISGTALNETLNGHANVDSAASRGLPDTTSANSRLFAISVQNDGVGEPWSEAMIENTSRVCAAALEALGLNNVGYLAHHTSLTARKIDFTPRYGCPSRTEWYSRIERAMGGVFHDTTLIEVGMVIVFGPNGAALVGPGYWCNLDGEGYDRWSQVPGMSVVGVDQRGWDVMHAGATHGQSADDPIT